MFLTNIFSKQKTKIKNPNQTPVLPLSPNLNISKWGISFSFFFKYTSMSFQNKTYWLNLKWHNFHLKIDLIKKSFKEVLVTWLFGGDSIFFLILLKKQKKSSVLVWHEPDIFLCLWFFCFGYGTKKSPYLLSSRKYSARNNIVLAKEQDDTLCLLHIGFQTKCIDKGWPTEVSMSGSWSASLKIRY